MGISVNNKRILGINGLGRIGKLSLWHAVSRRYFDAVTINMGRQAGNCMEDIVHFIRSDSTYGNLERFLLGVNGSPDIQILDSEAGLMRVHGLPVKVLREVRNPRDIPWREAGVGIVIDATGVFTDPTMAADSGKGSLRGHLEAGAQKVIQSSPFKIKDKSRGMPADSVMLIFGINHREYDPGQHHIVSSASCTTTGLAHMIKPLLETAETSRILTASMSTIHAATNTQSVIDSVPGAEAADLRKTRSVLNNIILSTTGAAKALEQVLPEIKRVGFMADSVRIPTSTVSLINLNLTLSSPLTDKGDPVINRDFINGIYLQAAAGPQKGLLIFSEAQNVSSDLMGRRAAVVIEGHDNHTRTGFIDLPPELLRVQGIETDRTVQIPVTHAKLFGWYDNEYGSYVNCMGELAAYMDKIL